MSYQYKGETYTSFSQIRKFFRNVSFPLQPTQAELEPFGITIVEESAEEPYSPTQEEIVNSYVERVQEHLNATAQERGYDNITTLATYNGSKIPKFNKEGTAGADWRDAVWDKCYAILAEVQAGTRTAPTDIISELPTFTWGD